ncbi:hypothetical protein [Microbulbifer sp. THAF38]|uniref:hypothetical protein n=1 Tax=Microbulbifer sp. THAF38 TaxID=2587856 RepID=UPI00126924A5|nr:hypothetical protein [Microbulbifer sp. THAF38]QFT55263.1 hypothetical protein FIU95_11915 [Microbulbifer sp. THAF38]
MKRLHIALSTDNIEETVQDYSARLNCKPCAHVSGEYALWRTDSLNLSIRKDSKCKPGTLRHLGWEDPSATAFTQDKDVNGIVWERFNAKQQAEEINNAWSNASYQVD